jgi:hypothetical protein
MSPRGAKAARRLVALALLGGVAGSGQPAQAITQECPVEGFDSRKIEEAARAAPSCERSFRVFRLCGSGASGDVGLGSVCNRTL